MAPHGPHGARRKAIAKFWTWWRSARPRVAKAVAAQDLGALEAEITAHVRAIDPGLAWELGPGDGKKLGFALVWDGDLARRRATALWLEGAPPRDATWDYFPARPAGSAWKRLVLEVGPHAIALADFTCTFEVDPKCERVHAKLFHPGFRTAPEQMRGAASFIMLDRAFGEDGVERWLGEIELCKSKPKGAKPIGELVKAVGKLSKRASGESCRLYQGKRDGAPIFVVTNEALKLIDHLDCDAELAIEIEMAEATAAGLPTPKESVALDALEDALLEELGDDAAYHGRETYRGKRTLYFFVPEHGRAVKRVTKWKKAQARRVAITCRPDPTWEGLERWS